MESLALPYAMRVGFDLLVIFQFHLTFGFMDLNKECASEDKYKVCQFKNNQTTGIKCLYKKFNDFETAIVPLLESPGPAKELNISLVKDTNHIVITWNLPHDSSVVKLAGFLVNVTFTRDGETMELLRTFKVDLEDQHVDQVISQAVIKYPCIGVFPQTLYRVQVISYPRSNTPAVKETEVYIPDFNFNVTAEASLSGYWKARMWSTIKEEGSMYSLTVCFYGAPRKFQMFFYFLLLRVKDQESDVEKVTISVENVTEADGQEICRTFQKLVNGSRNYFIYLLPRGPDDCVCEFKEEDYGYPVCYDACTMTYIGPIVLPATDSSPSDPPEGLPVNMILIVCLCIIFVVIVMVTSYLIYKYAISKVKNYMSKVQKGKVLIVIVNDMENTVSTALKRHLEKNLFALSYFDLTDETEVTGSSVSLLSDKIRRKHDRYLVVHRAGTKCHGLSDPELSEDRILAKSVRKFFKGGAKDCEEVCMHSFQLNSGSDPKAILKIIYDLVGNVGVFHPPEELSDDQASKDLGNLKCISTILIDSEQLESLKSSQRLDSGIGEEI